MSDLDVQGDAAAPARRHRSRIKQRAADAEGESAVRTVQQQDSSRRRKRKPATSQAADGSTFKPEDSAEKAATPKARVDGASAEPAAVPRSRVRAKAVDSKGKAKVVTRRRTGAKTSQASSSAWPCLRLSEPLGASARLPPVFSHDGRFCFVAAASSIKLYLVATSQLLSTLSLPSLPAGQRPSTSVASAGTNEITSLFVNPSNTLQLITTSLDGLIRIWDYLEGKVLWSINLEFPIACAALPLPESISGDAGHLANSIFVAVDRTSDVEYTNDLEKPAGKRANTNSRHYIPPTSIIFYVSLKRSEGGRRVRIGKCKGALDISLSSTGDHVVVVGRKKIHIAQIGRIPGSIVVKAPFVSFSALPENSNYADVTFTRVVCHPSEGYFATGDTRGTVRLWYLLNDESLASIQSSGNAYAFNEKDGAGAVPNGAVAVLHWHAHAVSSLAFTPNGAYLVSGGEEAVAVVWQISSRHKEFVPRLGAPIEALTITHGVQSGQQEIVARLKDGSIVFIGAGTLKVVRNVAGVKAMARQVQHSGSNMPLALEPQTNRLVFQASHPSAIQFYSATLENHVYEQDISPSNRVSRTDERPIEPTRVEHIAFSPDPSLLPATSSGDGNSVKARIWMATFDTWQDRNYARESHLKLWWGQPGQKNGYNLVTRIDNPHGQDRLSSLAFSPFDASGSGSCKLVTASAADSKNGTIKLWTHRSLDIGKTNSGNKTLTSTGVWQCRFSLSYRSLPVVPGGAVFSHDGSLLAVAHPEKVTLWNAETGVLVKAFSVAVADVGMKGLESIAFVGARGTHLVAGGADGLLIWDILTCQELASIATPANQIIAPAGRQSNMFLTASTSQKSARLFDLSCFSTIEVGKSAKSCLAATSKRIELPSTMLQTAAYPISDTSASKSGDRSYDDPVIATITKGGQVVLIGSESCLATIRPTAFASGQDTDVGAASMQAAALEGNKLSVGGDDLRPIRLFDEIFGPSALSQPAPAASAPSVPIPQSSTSNAGHRTIFDEIPAHKMPSLTSASVWKSLIQPTGVQLRPVAESSLGPLAAMYRAERQQMAASEYGGAPKIEDIEEDSSDSSDSDDEAGQEAKLLQNGDDMQTDEPETARHSQIEPTRQSNAHADDEGYVIGSAATEDELVELFRAGLASFAGQNSGNSPSKPAGIPKDRLAGRNSGSGGKSGKKRKSLLAGMV